MAAEAVVSVVVEQITSLLIAQARQEIDLLTGLEGKVENLLKTMKKIQAVLDDAEQRQIKDKTVKLWLKDLEDVSYDIDDVLDQWGYIILKQKIEGNNRNNEDDDIVSSRKQRVCSFTPSSCFCFKQVVVCRDMAIQIREITEKLNSIDSRKKQFSFTVSTSSEEEWKPVKTSSLVNESQVYGRDSYKNDLVNRLLLSEVGNNNEKFQVVAIVGAGGIGKTTLAQLVYNDEQVKAHFAQRVWVCVSNPFDEIIVANAIVESLTSSSSKLEELDPLVQKIKNTLSGKRFLIVFDDVWTENEDKWVAFHNIMRSGNCGSTILLTTRSKDVAMAANAAHIISVDVLSDTDSWLLFRQVALSGRVDNEIGFESLENIGQEIVRKCKGLPLAIKAIGSLLRQKKSEEWENIRDSNVWELEVAEVKLFPYLYLSYKDLSPLLRHCFSYCAIFPKDTVIEIDDLIRLWMAQGYLNDSRGGESEMEVEGRKYFDHLVARSLFQDFTEDDTMKVVISCKMHDIVHDFAQFVREGECFMIEREQEGESCVKNPRHVTLTGGAEVIDATRVKCNTSQCRSFFVENLQLKAPTTIDLLNSLKGVRVLKLNKCGLEELPKEIGTLTRLRYLGLKSNYSLRELPNTIYDLYNLQTLDLDKCYLFGELPPGVEKLSKLRHLVVRSITLPEGISHLTCLQTLPVFSIGHGCGNKFGYLKNLNQLRGSIAICISGDLDDSREVHNANLKSKKYIQVLEFIFDYHATITAEATEAMEPPPTLRKLCFHCYRQSSLPVWITSLTKLVSLKLGFCDGITSLDTVGMLPCLEKLKIKRCDQLKSIGPSFWGVTSSVAEATIIFPKLTKLIIWECRKLKYWEDISGSSSSTYTVKMMMPCLRCLVIYQCFKLKGLPYGFLRNKVSLERIEFNNMILNPTKFLSVVEAFSSAAQPQVEEDYDHHNNKVSPQQDKVTRTRSSILSELVYSKDYDELEAVMRLHCNGEEVVHLMDNLSSSAVEPILEIIIKIAKTYIFSGKFTKSLIDSGILPCLLRLWTNNQDSHIKDVICDIIESIIIWNKDHIQDVIDVGFIVPLINYCKVEPDRGFNNAINAATGPIASMIHRGTAEQIKFIVTQQDLLQSFFRAVSGSTLLCPAVGNIMEVGETIDEEGVNNNPFKQLIQKAGGLEILLQLKSHGIEWQRERATETLERYWPEVVEKEV